jgi:PAS domain S-box-containing protein
VPHSRYSDSKLFDHGNPAANFLHENFESVLTSWEGRVRAYLPAAGDKSQEELIDSVPFFMHGLIEALSLNGEEMETGEAGHAFRKHGVQRAALSGFSLHQIISEYFILRDVLFETLEKVGLLGSRERDIILRSVDFGLKECCSEFSHIRLTESRALLMQMERAHARDLNMLESINDPFAAFDFEGRFTYLNDAAERVFSCTRSDVLERTLWDVLPEALAAQLREPCERVLRERQTASFEVVSTFGSESGPIGETRVFNLKVYPSRDGFCFFVHDITEERPHPTSSHARTRELSSKRPH